MKQSREQQLLNKIIQKAWQDPHFKASLITSPLETIQSLTGEQLRLPQGKTIQVMDQSSQDIIYINIPAQPVMDDLELNEEQLEIIAGGGQLTEPGVEDVTARSVASLFNN